MAFDLNQGMSLATSLLGAYQTLSGKSAPVAVTVAAPPPPVAQQPAPASAVPEVGRKGTMGLVIAGSIVALLLIFFLLIR